MKMKLRRTNGIISRECSMKQGFSGQVREKNRGTHFSETTGKEMTSFSLSSSRPSSLLRVIEVWTRLVASGMW